MRVYCANGKQYLFPQVIASWSKHQKGHIIEETLISALGSDGSFILQRNVGEMTPVWMIFSPRVTSQRTYHQVISEYEAKAWAKAHLPAELCKECLNSWPFRKEENQNG